MLANDQVQTWLVGSRLRDVRIERFGLLNIGAMAEDLGVPIQTWKNYEAGVNFPSLHLLQFLVRTGSIQPGC